MPMVLIVDSAISFRVTMEAFLEVICGLSSRFTAADVEVAIELAEELRPSLVIMELAIPVAFGKGMFPPLPPPETEANGVPLARWLIRSGISPSRVVVVTKLPPSHPSCKAVLDLGVPRDHFFHRSDETIPTGLEPLISHLVALSAP